ncbi:6-bladed beta-propeller [Bacteroidota bacterium]
MNVKYCLSLFITLFFILLFCSCAIFLRKSSISNTEIVIFPSPPDTARIQFLTSFSTSQDITEEKSSFLKFVLGEEETKKINKPYGIAIRNSKIYICDLGIGGLEIIDLENNTFEYFIPSGKGKLISPANCFVDQKEYLYVTDVKRQQVVIFDDKGNYVNVIGNNGNFNPFDVYVTQDRIWVSDIDNHRICEYNKAGYDLLNSYPEGEQEDPQYLHKPTNIFLSDNEIFVCDLGSVKINKYTQAGEFVLSIGSRGKNIGQFVRPKGIALDNEKNLYVIDAAFENVQIFDQEGKLLMFFGGPYQGPGYMYLPAQITIDYDNLKYFKKYVDNSFELKYLIFVTNQYGPDKINVYGFVDLKEEIDSSVQK